MTPSEALDYSILKFKELEKFGQVVVVHDDPTTEVDLEDYEELDLSVNIPADKWKTVCISVNSETDLKNIYDVKTELSKMGIYFDSCTDDDYILLMDFSFSYEPK